MGIIVQKDISIDEKAIQRYGFFLIDKTRDFANTHTVFLVDVDEHKDYSGRFLADFARAKDKIILNKNYYKHNYVTKHLCHTSSKIINLLNCNYYLKHIEKNLGSNSIVYCPLQLKLFTDVLKYKHKIIEKLDEITTYAVLLAEK